MYARIYSYVLDGLDARQVVAEVDVRPGLPSFTIVGLGDLAVREARERVRCALANQGYELPQRRITVNLAPASLPKTGDGLDLPIALALLVASGQIPAPTEDVAVVGRLALDGTVRSGRGTLPIAEAAVRDGRAAVIVAPDVALEAALAPDVAVRRAGTLKLAAATLGAAGHDDRSRLIAPRRRGGRPAPTLDDVHGQEDAKARIRAAIEAPTRVPRKLLVIGDHGSGRALLARAVVSLLGPLDGAEALEVTRIQSACGVLSRSGLVAERPFRAPHHGTSALVLTGTYARPGEATLAHRGVLLLDDVHRFHADAVAALAPVLNDRRGTFVRHGRSCEFPADTVTIATAPTCACGRGSGPRCRCSTEDRATYERRMQQVRQVFPEVIELDGAA